MYSAKTGNILAFRLEKGEAVHDAFAALAAEHGIDGGFLVSGIGMLENPEIGYFVERGKYERKQVNGCFELLNLSGNLSWFNDDRMCHIHVMLADEEYKVFGGHLFAAKVGLTLEGYMQITDPASMHRTIEDDTGLPGLIIQ